MDARLNRINAMPNSKTQVDNGTDISPNEICTQLDVMTGDEVFRSSKRCVRFLRYVVEETLKGAADQIKERNVGIAVFGRDPDYDTNEDHIVRTAASELRKRLAIYYGQENHRSELRMTIIPGSYIPTFTKPAELKDNVLASTSEAPVI